jgi:hypothetical protein
MVIIKGGGDLRRTESSGTMMSKLSERLEAMVHQDGEQTAPVQVRLRAGLNNRERTNVVRKLQTRIPGAEYLKISGTVHGQVRLNAVERVSELPEVEWIDVEKEVPIEELIDPM